MASQIDDASRMKHFQRQFCRAYLVDGPDPQSLQPGLAETRQFGGCLVLGAQVASALHDFSGCNGAETISGLCGVSSPCSPPATPDTAQWYADSLGRIEVEEAAGGYSYGPTSSVMGWASHPGESCVRWPCHWRSDASGTCTAMSSSLARWR